MNTYDIIVIGGGPAGMMAAGRAGERGARVLLLEKNDTLGKKLLISGGGRCNLTNATFDRNVFLSKFRDAVKFLQSPLATFGIRDTLDFFESRGVPLKVEAENRVFPQSDDARYVFDALASYMREGSVTVMPDTAVTGFETENKSIIGIRLNDGRTICARSYILATGGKSHPETGSTGDGFLWLAAIGHTIAKSRPSLVPIRIRESWVRTLSGVSFADVKVTVLQNEKTKEVGIGKILFTHFGLSGPLVLNMSRAIGDLLGSGPVNLTIDLFPASDEATLDMRIRASFDQQRNRLLKNSVDGLIPPLCIKTVLLLAGLDPDRPVHDIKREERLALATVLKGLRMTVEGLLDADKAIVTSGGVSPTEIDFKRMRSRLFPNLYLVGDILDIDRPSGGYSLQLYWTTGFVAGTSATADIVSSTSKA